MREPAPAKVVVGEPPTDNFTTKNSITNNSNIGSLAANQIPAEPATSANSANFATAEPAVKSGVCEPLADNAATHDNARNHHARATNAAASEPATSNHATNSATSDRTTKSANCADVVKTRTPAASKSAPAPAQIRLINAFAGATGCAAGEFDAVSITYGIRNVVELDAALAEFHRILRRGGRLVVLEFTRRDKRGIIARLRDFYLAKILPRLGGAISKNRAAYEYLPSSIEGFLDAGEFCERLKRAGFEIEICKGFSFNVSTMFVAKKP